MKVFEKIVRKQMCEFLECNNILSSSGFQNNHSTDTAVLCVSDFIINELSKGRFVGAVLIYPKKSIRHSGPQHFIEKALCYGFRETSLDWFQSYLNRLHITLLLITCNLPSLMRTSLEFHRVLS